MAKDVWEWQGDAPAFPTLPEHYRGESDGIGGCIGLTKLEFFAAMAMAGFLAADAAGDFSLTVAARFSVDQANTTLKALYNPELLDEE